MLESMVRKMASISDEAALSEADFAAVTRLAYDHSGLDLPASKHSLVASRLAKLVRAKGCSLSAYIAEAARDKATLQDLIQALTTNHTKFFREPHHFDHFVQVVRPEILAAIDARRPVRLWSAGSSSGEEVYTLTMSLLGASSNEAAKIAKADVALLATDINHDVLNIGRTGRYDAAARAEMPEELARRWVQDQGRQIEVAAQARALVRFRHLNLIGHWPIRVKFDAIFCRNTMIYFDAPTTERLQCRLADQLRTGGYLYIGHSERLIGRAAELLENVGQTIFRKAAA